MAMAAARAWLGCRRPSPWATQWHRAAAPVIPQRGLHATAATRVQRLLWAGSILDQQSPVLSEVPKDWLLAMGAQADVEQGIAFTGLAASQSHMLLSYKTLPPSLPVAPHQDGFSKDDDNGAIVHPAGLHKIAAVGRNTFGELGLGFASQESTWGLVSRGFEGAGGVVGMACGLGYSWVATDQDKGSQSASFLYAFGNHTSGQLGLGGPSRAHALSEGGEPQLELSSSPRRASLEYNEGIRIEAMASGLDHTVLVGRASNGEQAIYTCGVNTDGQLGSPHHRVTSTSLQRIDPDSCQPPLPSTGADPIVGVAAGGDTSLLWTSSGRIWGWGNSEYAQALVGGKPIDRIDVPTEGSRSVADAIGNARVVDMKLGGSFVLVLDDKGNVYTAGFGPLGQGKDNLESHTPCRILQNASRIHAGLEQASAVVHGTPGKNHDTHLAVWGLDTPAGRLGLGARKPYPSYMIASRFTPNEVDLRVYQPALVQGLRKEWLGLGRAFEPAAHSVRTTSDHAAQAGIIDVVHGRDAMLVLVEDGTDEVGRWKSRALR